MLSPPWPTSSASLSTTPPSALITLPSPPDSSEKAREAPARLPSSVVQALDIILQQQLRQEDLWGYVDDKIRYDWNPFTGELIYRMPTAIHDVFIGYVVTEIITWLYSLNNRIDVDPHVRALACAIAYRASARIYYHADDDEKEYGEHCPDTSFAHIEAEDPGVVIETSFLQKRKDLPKLADDYILGSLGNTLVVIGFDIEYRGTKEATISVWKPENGFNQDGNPYLRVKTVVDAEPFRNSDGSLVSDGNLTLSFGDLFPACMTSSITRPLPTYTIPYLKLAGFLQFGEAYQQVTEAKAGYGKKRLPAGVKIYRRPASPEETLSLRREKKFAESERQAEERAMREDSAYGQWQTKGKRSRP
ncbi:MAG: hypothetical protein M1840_001794 [Geoglossum simile]|nr:MAG: hypothetical protein M1840_001794 [Geoglossum simile]